VRKPSPQALAVWVALLRAHRHLVNALDAELRAASGISLDEYDALYQLSAARTPLRMRELSERLLVSRAALTRLVDRLVDAGFVERGHDVGDRRVVRVSLTDRGRRKQKETGRIHLDGLARLVGDPLVGQPLDAVRSSLEALGDGQPLDMASALTNRRGGP
jgi:DNA-binding MarR family transcriptional regulator